MEIPAIEGLYSIIPMRVFRRTPGVAFDVLPHSSLPQVDAFDRVIHTCGAVSPGPVGDIERPWYMHTHQADNLMVLHGERYVELYTPAHGSIEAFNVTADTIRQGDTVLWDGPAMLVWPTGVFHRVNSSAELGSASINLATHIDGWDVRTNFSIYDLDIATGEYRVIREGYLDQD